MTTTHETDAAETPGVTASCGRRLQRAERSAVGSQPADRPLPSRAAAGNPQISLDPSTTPARSDAGRGLFAWNEDSDAILRELWAQTEPRMTALEIARAMGTTKNSIAGRVHRLKLPKRAVWSRAKKPAPVAVAPKPAAPKPPAPPAPPTILARRPAVVRHRTCQWVAGERPWRFCVEPTLDGSSYCAAHHARCFRQERTAIAECMR